MLLNLPDTPRKFARAWPMRDLASRLGVARPGRSSTLRSAAVLTLLAFGLASHALANDEATLTLSAENLGMTGEQVAANANARQAEVAKASMEPTGPSEADSSEWQTSGAGADCPAPLLTNSTAGPATFESCVETAIRAGNALTPSTDVCKSLYAESASTSAPEPTPEQASAGDETSAATEGTSGEAELEVAETD